MELILAASPLEGVEDWQLILLIIAGGMMGWAIMDVVVRRRK